MKAAIGIHKGGDGKTTLCIHIAVLMAWRGYKVCVIDSDPQATCTAALGQKPAAHCYELMARETPLQELVRPVSTELYTFNRTDPKGFLGIIAGNNETGRLSDANLDPEYALDRLETLEEAFDLILWDTQPSETGMHATIYSTVDATLHPTQTVRFSRNALANTFKYIERANNYRRGAGLKEIVTIGIVPNRVQMDTMVQDEGLALLREKYGALVWEPIAERTAWQRAVEFGTTVFASEAGSQAAKDGYQLVDRFQEAINVIAKTKP